MLSYRFWTLEGTLMAELIPSSKEHAVKVSPREMDMVKRKKKLKAQPPLRTVYN